MYKELYKDGSVFTVSLLVPQGETLVTWISQSNNESFNHCKGELLRNINRNDVFGLSGNSVASKCWRHNQPLSSNTHISFIYENQEDRLKSIIAMPIECSDKLYLKINESHYSVDKVVGILCVTSSNPHAFSEETCDVNMTMLTPLRAMINLQYSLRAIEKLRIEEGQNEEFIF